MNNIKKTINITKDIFTADVIANNIKLNQYSEKTKAFINKLSNSTTEIIKDFLAKNATEIPLRNKQSKLYHYDNLLITITNGKNAYNLEQNLNTIHNEGVAPKYIQYYELGKDEFLSVLEGDSEALIPYSKALGLISNNNKRSFKNSLMQIAALGQINKEIFANRAPLFVGKNSKNIIYGDWENLSIVDQSMKSYYLSQIDKISI